MKRYITVISFLLTMVTLLGGFGVFANAADLERAQTVPDLDFSSPLSEFKSELSPSDLLSILSPDTAIGEAERRYLDRYSEACFLINDSFSNDVISISRSGDTLCVTAEEYCYVAANGYEVRWIPLRAVYGDVSNPLNLSEGGAYTACFAYAEDISHVSAEYTCSVLIPAEDANYILNFAYREAEKGIELEEKYASIMSEYLERFRQYEEALAAIEQYEQDKQEYDNYFILKEQYEKDLAAYTKYLSELAEYEKKLAEYNKYQEDYEQYLVDKANYDKIYSENINSMDEYLAYYNQLNKIRAAMYAMENIYTRPSPGIRSLYGALQNKELLTMFEKYKNELTLYGIKIETIDSLTVIANELNDMLKEYDEVRQISEQAAFEFYKANYEEICYKFNFLYDSMMEIMTPTIFNHICIMVNTEYEPEEATRKKKRITNVLAHIYLVSKCLDDTESAAGAWEFFDYERNNHTYYFPELMEPTVIISDTNAADPSDLTWPDNPPDFTLPPLPTEPEKVAQPLAPKKVDSPTEPILPDEPVYPGDPIYPGEAPSEFEEVRKTAAIAEALREQSLLPRAEFSDDVSLQFTHTVKKLVSSDGYPVLTVYAYDKTTVLDEMILERAEDFALPEEIPERESDKLYDYTFLGWSLSPDTLTHPDPEALIETGEDVSVYAVYSSEERKYSITWITANGEISQEYKYGEQPVFDGDPEKAPTDTLEYSFDGWSPMIDIVTENTVYTAQYSEHERLYSAVWKINGKTTSTYHPFGDIPTPPQVDAYYISGCDIFRFSGWDVPTGNPISENTTYTAVYTKSTLITPLSGTATLFPISGGYRVELTEKGAYIDELLTLAASEDKRIEIAVGNATVSLDKASVVSLAQSDAKEISLEYTISEGFGDCKLTIKDGNGNLLSSGGEIHLELPCEEALPALFHIYEIVSGGAKKETPYTQSDGMLTFSVRGSAELLFTRLYSVTLAQPQNGGVILDGVYLREKGDPVRLIFYPDVGYTVDAIIVTRADDGSSVEFNSFDDFTMPNCDITITVKFERTRYTVEFVVNGQVISSEKYFIGDMPKIPEITTEYEENGYKYVFAGWSSAVSAVTHDEVYYAKYNSVLIDMESSGEKTGNEVRAFLKYTVLPFAAVFIALCTTIFVLVFLLRKNKKNKKKHNSAEKAKK